MKAKRFPFELFALSAIAALLVWRFWPHKNPPASVVITAPMVMKSAALSKAVTKPAVEAPNLPPAEVSPVPDSVSLASNGSSLYAAAKARAAATNSARAGDEDYNTIVKGSPTLQKVDNILAQDTALAQSLAPTNPSTKLPMIVTELGTIILTEDVAKMRKLASGDEAIFTLKALPAGAPADSDNFLVSVNFLYPNANGSFDDTGIQDGTVIQLGRGAMIRNFPTGNEIHFTPELANQAGTSP